MLKEFFKCFIEASKGNDVPKPIVESIPILECSKLSKSYLFITKYFTDEYRCESEKRKIEIKKQQIVRKWEIINLELNQREIAAQIIIKDLSDYEDEKQKRVIAETVMTIENAQTYLTEKADSFYRLGAITTLITFTIMLFMGLHLLLDVKIVITVPEWIPTFFTIDANRTAPSFETNTTTTVTLPSGEKVIYPSSVSASKLKELNATEITITETSHTYDFIAYTMRRLAGGGFIAGLVIFLIYLARSFFHESTAFKNERHNIRLGKLIPYAIDPEKMNFKEFQEITQWGKESNSSFKDIRPELSGKTILTYMVEGMKAMRQAEKDAKEDATKQKDKGTS
jgi:hypothetical protein